MKYEVFDNFLDQEDFDILKTTMEGPNFPWYFNDGVLTIGETSLEQYQFTHTLYNFNTQKSDYFNLFLPLLNKISPISIVRIKANLNPRTNNIYEHGYHTDYLDSTENQKTAVFYINTNNGYTIFEDETKVESLENRLVVFDTNMLHSGSTCTDQKRRIVVNLNYLV